LSDWRRGREPVVEGEGAKSEEGKEAEAEAKDADATREDTDPLDPPSLTSLKHASSTKVGPARVWSRSARRKGTNRRW